MNQKQAETKKIVKVANEPISIKESTFLTLSQISVIVGNRTVKSLTFLMISTALIALVSAIVGHFVPLWAGIIVSVALSVGACYAFDRKVPIKVPSTRESG